jgi:hypothetical protein
LLPPGRGGSSSSHWSLMTLPCQWQQRANWHDLSLLCSISLLLGWSPKFTSPLDPAVTWMVQRKEVLPLCLARVGRLILKSAFALLGHFF